MSQKSTDDSNGGGTETSQGASSSTPSNHDAASDGRIEMDIRTLLAMMMTLMVGAFAAGVGFPPTSGGGNNNKLTMMQDAVGVFKYREDTTMMLGGSYDAFSLENDTSPPVGEVSK